VGPTSGAADHKAFHPNKGEVVQHSEKKIPVTFAAGVLGVAVVIPLLLPNTASAQSGSRLCGRIYKTTPGSVDPSNPNRGINETVIRLYEVQKNDNAMACGTAQNKANRRAWSSPFTLRQQVHKFWDIHGKAVEMVICEDFKTDYLNSLDVDFQGEGWPARDQNDICNNMNRSDTVFEMETYWLYHDDDQPTSKWAFRRG
jgi:hypothetical protein